MSNIYIQEPPTLGKVLIKTTVGDIDIELWSKECPKACRNFIQLCMEGYYNGTVFHRVVKGFIVQGGDPNGDGTGGESIYGEPFKDEFHSRLRYIRRGLVGMANSDKDDNASQFFFTMAPTPELQNKNTLFGKVTGDTVYNMLKLEEGLVDHNERPMYPHRVNKVEILSNPFDDIIPREKAVKKKEKKKSKEKGVKNFGLLSFGEEAEEDEQETTSFVQKNSGKGKSTHDVLNDPTLSKKALEVEKNQKEQVDIEEANYKDNLDSKERTERIKNKLKSHSSLKKNKTSSNKGEKNELNSDSDDDYLMTIEQEKQNKRNQKKQEIQQEILSLKRNYKEDQKKKETMYEKKIETEIVKNETNILLKEYNNEKEKYTNLQEKLPKKGSSREDFTLSLLSKFRNKLESVREKASDVVKKVASEEIIENDIKTDDWLAHTLRFEDGAPVLAKDASTKSDDWYDAFDPRNPLNKRKRGDAKSESKKKKEKEITSRENL